MKIPILIICALLQGFVCAAVEGVLPPYESGEAKEKNKPASLEARYRVADKRVVKVTIKNVSGKPVVLRLLKAKLGKDKLPANYKYTTIDLKEHSYAAPHIQIPASPYPTFGYNFIYLFNNDTYEYDLFTSAMEIASIDSIVITAPFFDPKTTQRKDLPGNFQAQSWLLENEILPKR